MRVDGALVAVAVVSTRSGLDLAINAWVPGYLARTSRDLDTVLELVRDDGIIVVDLVDADRRATLQALVDRCVAAPVVAVLPDRWQGSALPGDPLVVAEPSEVASLAEALARARRIRGVGALDGNGGEAVTVEHVIDLTDAAASSTCVPSSAAAVDRPNAGPAASLPPADEVDVGAVLRGWALLGEVEGRLGGASAVVAVRSMSGTLRVAAGIDLAAFEAEPPIDAEHPVLSDLRQGPGWLLRTPNKRRVYADLPLEACPQLLAVGVPELSAGRDGLLLVGHFRSVDPRTAADLVALAGDADHLEQRLRLLGSVTAPLDLDTLIRGGSSLPAWCLPASWNLLGQLYASLRGPAVVLTRCSSGTFIATATQHLSAAHALRPLHEQHALLQRLRTIGGPVVVASQPANRALVSGLPVPYASHLAAFPVGDPAAPDALVVLARHEPVSTAEQQRLAATIAAHPMAVEDRARNVAGRQAGGR